MPVVIEKWSIEYLISCLSPELVPLVVVALLVSWLTFKANRYFSAAMEQAERLNVIEKQQHKVQQLLSAATCVSKNNGLWLQDPSRNGGQPPEPMCCKYLAAKERGEL
ncbi:MAG TPA: hypothetical protein PLM07_18730 [Candidatus Rifleibacterium sp.]|nr:hypothetical protein [Candidatus Rifleibacterium sp.]